MKKNYVLAAGAGAYFILFLLAFIYFKERTVFLDSSYHIFQIVRTRAFAIQGNRFGAALTQIYPLIATKMHLSLSAIAKIYSLSFIIFFTITFLLTLFGVNNSKMALSIVLFNILMVTHTFYWPHPELPTGVVFTLFFFALLDRSFKENRKKSPGFLIVTLLFLITIVFFHPLLIFVFFFLTGYSFLHYRKQKKFLMILSAAFLVIVVLKKIFFRSAYESDAIQGLKNGLAQFPNYINTTANINLVSYFIHDYYFVPMLLLGVSVFYLKRKAFGKLVLMLGFFGGLCFIINLNYINGSYQFYLEAQYLLLSLFVIIPFVYDALPAIKRPQLSLALVSLFIGISAVRIYNTHAIYSERVDVYRKFLAGTSALPQKKLILSSDEAPTKTLLMTWASSYEGWLLSTLEQGNSRSIIIEEKNGEFDWAIKNNNILITKWELFDYNNLDPQYFVFRDTTFYIHY